MGMIGNVIGMFAASAVVVAAFGSYSSYTERAAQAVAAAREAERVGKLTPNEIAAEKAAAAQARNEQMRKKHGWQTEEIDDTVSGKKSVVTTARSLNTFSLARPFHGDQSAYISVRQHPRFGHDVFISVERGQLYCAQTKCYISTRFDGGNVKRYAVSEPDDGRSSVWFIDDAKGFSAQLAKSNRTFVELQFFKQGALTVEFLTEGLKRP